MLGLKASLDNLEMLITDQRFESGKIVITSSGENEKLSGKVILDRVEISESDTDIISLILRMGEAAKVILL